MEQGPRRHSHGPIDLISRNSTAGTLSNFTTLLIGGKKVSSLASEESSEGLQREAIEKDPNSIGFLSGYFASQGVNDVAFNGVGCTLANATAGSYAGVARFYEVTKGKATGAASAFIGWIERQRGRAEDHLHAVDLTQVNKPTGAFAPTVVRPPRRAHARRGVVDWCA